MRLNALRDGIEDYEFFWRLRANQQELIHQAEIDVQRCTLQAPFDAVWVQASETSAVICWRLADPAATARS